MLYLLSPYAFILTLLCSEWHPYKNVDGITTTIRNYLKTHHSAEYEKIVHTLKLKHSNDNTLPSHPSRLADASTSNSMKKIRPGDKPDIVLYTSS
jgi:hypothetical protein